MISRYEYSGGVWIDIEKPNEDEVRSVLGEYGISERVVTEILSPTPVPLVAGDAGAVLLVLHFPAPHDEAEDIKSQEIDFIVGEGFIITVRYELVTSLHHLKKLLETEAAVNSALALSTDVMLELLFAHLYTSIRDHVTHSADQLDRIEKQMFSGKEHQTVRAISDSNRDFLHLEATLVNHEEPLSRFLKTLSERNFFGNSFEERAARIAADRVHVVHLIRTYRAVATELRETNKVLVETRQSEIMKALTVMTIIVLPLELIAFIFGMHAPGTPLLQHPNAFWIILALMLAMCAVVALFLSRKRWI
ncbi:hypothetical protein COU19_00705 [Candidatus Kaiserbacteria bacterium CG10_big_fil_rev_8_21_14_0_10_56_12]|uniref:Magnesium transporter CorA n=1 Tax=Candidatus Kaiserbacteria bacterium CG10_big_fil_rev_8_21_14_0_10_56_12 TaxID=1974611 RepID=A0A2H0UAF0_9BACT|nr:MAG: hypothetical protein COU19_00705 [Candidatus Kaiserbacteria bacterium CG10_big_fil_rev_8_21_14_0_10_56_12]